jgi:periplasmic protein TonB
MGYQALLFCPDEKTARTVTQVLSELDFTVVPCTEPFAAVKKLMGEHFDAVVVDCDNEQNATLLFKSARNTPNNQSSLAVAVVEGQAGVAKAFRIGANLVLTKPINVEQAKGTLRVARGLLRKNEAGKPAAPAAGATGGAVKPAAPAPTPAPPKAAPQVPSVKVVPARPTAPVAPTVKAATASIPTQKPAPQPTVVASAASGIDESDGEILELSDEVDSPAVTPSIVTTKTEISASHSEIFTAAPSAGLSTASPAGFGSSAGSAPAPAREQKPSVGDEGKATAIPESGSAAKVADLSENATSIDGGSGASSAPAPAFTFGGNVGSGGGEAASGGSKKALLAVAAVVLIAAGGYAVWMQWVRSSGAATPFTHVVAQPVATPVAAPQMAPKPAPATSSPASSVASPTTSSTSSATPDSAAASQSKGPAQSSTDSDAQDDDSAEGAPAHSTKGSDKAAPAKSPAPAANKASASKAAQPIVIKNDLSQPVAKPAPTADAPAPSMTGIASADNGALPNLMGGQSDAPTPVLQSLTVSQGVSQGLLIKKAQPTYPPNALQMHVEGTVELLATISKTGNISALKVLSGNPSLARAATDAVKQWKYKPYLLNGEPVEIQTQVTINFKLPK